jgi:hypothetical protein
MVSGNKGGVGKSLFCLALGSALEMLSHRYAVLDGDGRTGDVLYAFARRVPTHQGDFRELRPESHACPYDTVYAGMLVQLLRASDHLIINTPDGADSVLIKWFEKTLHHAENNNVRFKFVYLMSTRPDGLEILIDLHNQFQFFYPVRNLYFGDVTLFSAFNQRFSQMFREIIDFPKLRSAETAMLFDLKTYPFEAVNLRRREGHSLTIPILSRSRLLRWQNKINDSIMDMIDNEEIPTIKMG